MPHSTDIKRITFAKIFGLMKNVAEAQNVESSEVEDHSVGIKAGTSDDDFVKINAIIASEDRRILSVFVKNNGSLNVKFLFHFKKEREFILDDLNFVKLSLESQYHVLDQECASSFLLKISNYLNLFPLAIEEKNFCDFTFLQKNQDFKLTTEEEISSGLDCVKFPDPYLVKNRQDAQPSQAINFFVGARVVDNEVLQR